MISQVDEDSAGGHLIAPKGGKIYSMGSIDVKEYYGERNKYAICEYSTSTLDTNTNSNTAVSIMSTSLDLELTAIFVLGKVE